MSLFISFEGGEGSGKSTQAEILLRRVQQAGMKSTLVHEPGTTLLGDFLRAKLKQQIERERSLSPAAELFMFAASRAELVAKEIRPALKNPDRVVIADRFADSTMAYQGYGRRLSLEDVIAVNRVATQGIVPNLTFLLDRPPDTGLGRLSPQFKLPIDQNETEGPRVDLAGTRRFEVESLDFHRRVRDGYLAMAEEEPDRWHVLDATSSIEEISDSIWRRVEPTLPTDTEVSATGRHSDLPLWSSDAEPPAADSP